MPHHLPIKSFEPLREFAARYAEFRGVRLIDFLRHTGLPLLHHSSFDRAVGMLAKMTGNDHSVLLAHALRLNGDSNQQILGQSFRRIDVAADTVRCCPRCVVREHSEGGRRPFANVSCHLSWKHRHIRYCAHHGVPLMTFPKSNGWTDQIDFKTKLVRNWAHVVNAAVSAEQIEISKYERYFNNRLIGITGSNEVLDGLPLLSAFRICELVGVMELKGDEVSPRSLKSDEHYEALTLGYETLADGYMGLRAFLQKRDQMFQTHRKKGFGFGLYGPLYRHLNRFRDEPEYAEITAFVSKHLFEHHPTSPETLYLGHAGGSGTLISIRSAVTQHGIDGQTLRKLLVAAGLIDPKAPGSNGKIALSSEDMDAIIARWRDRLSRLDAMDRLGVDGAVLKKLAAAGLIKMTPRQHGLDPAYSSSSIESLIAAIDGVATADPNAKSMSTLKGSGLTKTFAQIIALILEGKLTAGISKHPPEATKLSDIRIDASALKAVPTDICLADWMPFANVKVLLKTSTAGISGLESIDEFAPPRTYISGNRAIHRFYPRASIVGFHKTYVSYDRLSKRRAFAVNPEALLASYEPAFDFGGRDRFYRRSDLAI